MDWAIIEDAADAHAFAGQIAGGLRRPPQNAGGTALGAALLRAERLLRACPCEADRWVVDVSGDGEDNRGPTLDLARAGLLANGITINGLPMSIDPSSAGIAAYFEENVIGGEAAFVVPVDSLTSFGPAIIQKLTRELVS